MRLLAFFLTALGAEIWSGAGLLSFGGAVIVGRRRINPSLALVAAAAGFALSLFLVGEPGSGKVAHSLTNAPFLLFMHIILAAAGYAAGRLAGRWRRS